MKNRNSATADEEKRTPDSKPGGARKRARDDETAAAKTGEAADPQETAPPEPETAAPEPDAAALAAEVAALKDQLLRALAETENVRRRAAVERKDVSKYAITAFARDLAQVVDNLRRALDSVPEEVRSDQKLAGVLAGVEMTEREFLSIFERHGVRCIDPLGEKFDHNYHQAVIEVDDSDKPGGTVVEVMQVGYAISGRLLRPAMVAVAKGAKSEPPPRVDAEA